MSYHKHQTKAIILSGMPLREGDRLLTVFTREFGLIRAFARSVRTERSKLRPLLQDFTCGTISLVRGKEYWRVVGMSRSASFYYAIRGKEERLAILARLSLLTKRLLPGEEKNHELYDTFVSSLSALTKHARTEEECALIESLAAARSLVILGHLPKEPFGELLSKNSFESDVLTEAMMYRSQLIEGINTALRDSGL